MDYIREELLRQRTALSALLLGGEEREEQETVRTPAADREFPATAAGRGPEWVRTEETLPVEGAVSAAGGGALRRHLAQRSRALRAAILGTAEAAGAAVPVDGGGSWTVDGGENGENAETVGRGPEVGGLSGALSRAFQRDARRYDGGFSLY